MIPARAAHVALCAACVLYALFSSPTPDAPGLVEYAVLALMGVAALSPQIPAGPWVRPLGVFAAYGLCVPLAVGVLRGAAPGDILRDMVAFAALCMPLLYAHLFPAGDGRTQKILLAALLGVGLAFAVRYLWGAAAGIASLGGGALPHHFLYLANAPLVAFAAVFLLLHGCFSQRRVWLAVLCVALALMPLAAMVGMMQRASLALLVVVWFLLFIRTALVAPRRACVVAACACAFLVVLWPFPALVAQSLYDKTLSVGWNARGAELAAVLESAGASPTQALLGNGWGALLKSPAVGEQWVRFSHGLFPSLLWKTGWLGLALGLAAMAALVFTATRRLRGDCVMCAALILPLLPALFLYGSYKSLCFGLLLLGIASLRLDKTPVRMVPTPPA